MKKYLAIFVAGLITYWIIGGLFIFFTDYSPGELIALFLETVFG